MKCPKCGGETEEGVYGGTPSYFIVDPVFVNKTKTLRKKGFLGFSSVPQHYLLSRWYRCKTCGYIEAYAQQ